MNIRSAIILCGGRGSTWRIRKKKFPKTLIKIQSKPILWYILNSLKKIVLIILFYRQDIKENKLKNLL